jgi:hypothetical protein
VAVFSYSVLGVVPGESIRLKDILFPEHAPIIVQEKAGSRQAVKFDLIAARVLPVKELVAVIIPDYWLKLFAIPFKMPKIVDQVTGEPILLITEGTGTIETKRNGAQSNVYQRPRLLNANPLIFGNQGKARAKRLFAPHRFLLLSAQRGMEYHALRATPG